MKAGIPTATVVQSKINGITIEVCHGEIPDEFRQLKFGTLKELELPDRKVTDEQFDIWWIDAFREAGPKMSKYLLDNARCS